MNRLPQVLCVFGLLAASSSLQASTTIGFEDLQGRDNFGQGWNNWNTYQGYTWGYGLTGGVGSRTFDGNETGWASGTVTDPAISPAPSGLTGTAFAWTWNGPQSLWIDFGSATDVTSVDLAILSTGYFSNSSTVQLFGYDSADNLIASTGVFALTDTFQTLTANLPAVRYVEFRSNSQGSWFSVDQLVLDGTVPEPATWAMMIIGFGFVGTAMRSRRNRELSLLHA